MDFDEFCPIFPSLLCVYCLLGRLTEKYIICVLFVCRVQISHDLSGSVISNPEDDELHQISFRTTMLTSVMIVSKTVFGLFGIGLQVHIVSSADAINRIVYSICICLMFLCAKNTSGFVLALHFYFGFCFIWLACNW